jgi:hypothetical protein
MMDLSPDEAQVIQRMRADLAARAPNPPASPPEQRLSLRIVRTPAVQHGEHEKAVNAILGPLTARGRIARPPTLDVVDGHLLTTIWIVDPVTT